MSTMTVQKKVGLGELVNLTGDSFTMGLYITIAEIVEKNHTIVIPEVGKTNNVLAEDIGEVKLFRKDRDTVEVTTVYDFRNK